MDGERWLSDKEMACSWQLDVDELLATLLLEEPTGPNEVVGDG